MARWRLPGDLDAADVRKILGENLVRVWEAVVSHAVQLASADQVAKTNQ